MMVRGRAGIVRQTEAMRWLNIVVRTAHIGAAAMLFACATGAISVQESSIWHYLIIATGDALVVMEWLHDRRWVHRGKGLLAILHLGLFIVIQFHPGWTVPLLWAILILGSVCSHMPRRYRHWSIIQGWERRETGNAYESEPLEDE